MLTCDIVIDTDNTSKYILRFVDLRSLRSIFIFIIISVIDNYNVYSEWKVKCYLLRDKWVCNCIRKFLFKHGNRERRAVYIMKLCNTICLLSCLSNDIWIYIEYFTLFNTYEMTTIVDSHIFKDLYVLSFCSSFFVFQDLCRKLTVC